MSSNNAISPAAESAVPQPGDRLRPGEVSPDAIEYVTKDLDGAALLCSGLAMLGDDGSQITPEAVEALGALIRKAAADLKKALSEAENRI